MLGFRFKAREIAKGQCIKGQRCAIKVTAVVQLRDVFSKGSLCRVRFTSDFSIRHTALNLSLTAPLLPTDSAGSY